MMGRCFRLLVSFRCGKFDCGKMVFRFEYRFFREYRLLSRLFNQRYRRLPRKDVNSAVTLFVGTQGAIIRYIADG